jgi:outer membrane lipoprotein-sorting protein
MTVQKLLGAIVVLATAITAPVQAVAPIAQAPRHFSPEDQAALQRATTYLNSLQSVEGNFVQLAHDGRSTRGTVYIKKPGRIRFEYEKPNPTLIVADGTTVAVENNQLRTTDRYPIGNTPLRLLLTTVDLANDPHVVSIQRQSGLLAVTAAERSGPATGQVTMYFADTGNTLQLSHWDVEDARGQHTMVSVSGLHDVADLPPQLFTIEDMSPFRRTER